ncbi:predicted protein [Nematostella vectensis]|uniref:UDP-N-acetylglucosamine 1-carboxyvinyltransferase n=1 Tax=Nematostella vectensis TaxID=45351 RepID=A7RUC5_NEMVE|nr:UDP-N-acetylglucosamine 1-carboxyvinyltransferase [Nematostella vectensis]EDO45052.1 predicted protein [Nematostella vectensis]|eukprot:XP_001637115.1 predicted protein [Nematostella vectensis]
MSQLHVRGGYPLRGTIRIPGAKNAALPLMAASLLTTKPVRLTNIPKVTDVNAMAVILQSHGVAVEWRPDDSLVLDARNAQGIPSISSTYAPIRSSIFTLGPAMGRFGEAMIQVPGGCQISQGGRPIDLHFYAMRKLGAIVDEESGLVKTNGNRLRGARITFDKVSVGATINALMAACLVQGKTILENAAMEAEIDDLVCMLRKMGAQIDKNRDTKTWFITGVSSLHGADHGVVPDRIVAGTYAVAAVMTGGELTLTLGPCPVPALMGCVLTCLRAAGAEVMELAEGIRVRGGRRPRSVSITTSPYPGFPTDMQPQWMALMCMAQGSCEVKETIFDHRFQHVKELRKLGANLECTGKNVVRVQGVDLSLMQPSLVQATDLRAAAALLLVGLAIPGETVIQDIHHLERGYEDVVRVLSACGARLEKKTAP